MIYNSLIKNTAGFSIQTETETNFENQQLAQELHKPIN